MLFALLVLLPPLFVAWPPQVVERRIQREKVREWVKMAGGWDAIRLEVLTTSKREAYRPGVGYWGGGAVGNYHSTYKEVAEGIYEVY